jgi:methyltransferase (TIGR00027 family)
MLLDRASRTAEYMAFYRALESARPASKRLFADPFAVHFLGPGLARAVRFSRWPLAGGLVRRYADWRLPGAGSSGVARTRFIDDLVGQARDEGISQVVILGAGFDCRAYRLPSLSQATVFEVDHPATLAVKLERLRPLFPTLPAHVRFVEVDFNHGSLAEALPLAGFDPGRRSLVVWEGVTNYLAGDAVAVVLRFVAGCATGSRLVFTYVDRRALDGSASFWDAAALLRFVALVGEPWTFGLDPRHLSEYLIGQGLRLETDAGAREYRARYFGREADRMKGYDFYHVAVARVPGPH